MKPEKLTSSEILQLTGKTVVFEGIQGSGKTTVIKELGMLFDEDTPVKPVNVRVIRETTLSEYERELNRGIHELMASGELDEATVASVAKTMLVREQLQNIFQKANSVYFEDRSIDTTFLYDTFVEHQSSIAQTNVLNTRWDDLSEEMRILINNTFREKIHTALEMGYDFPDITFFLFCEDQEVARERDQGGSVDAYIVQDLYQQYYAIREEMVPNATVHTIRTDIASIQEVTELIKERLLQ